MTVELSKLRAMPQNAKRAVAFMLVGWVWLIISVYWVFDPSSVVKFLISGAIVCWFMLSLKNWARMLGLFCACTVILYCGVFGALFFLAGEMKAALIAVVNVILFGVSGYYLLTKSTTAFFKSQNPSENAASDQDQR
jgi:hypothetical protein